MMDNDDQEGEERTPSGPPRRKARDFDQSTSAKVDTTGKKRDFSHIVRPHSDYGGTSFSSESKALKTKGGDDGNQDTKGELRSSGDEDTMKPKAALSDGYAANDSAAHAPGDETGSTLERSRAMSRIYSQRNRDKQKRQIQDLTEAKIQLDRENSSLRMMQQDFVARLRAAKAEGEMLKRQLLTNRVANAMNSALLPSRGTVQPQQQPYLNHVRLNNDALLAAAAAGFQIDNSFLNLTSTLAQQQQLPGGVPGRPPSQGILPLHQEITALDSGGRRLSSLGTPSEERKDPSSSNSNTNNSMLVEERRYHQLNPPLLNVASNQHPASSISGGGAPPRGPFLHNSFSHDPSVHDGGGGTSLLGNTIEEMQRQLSAGSDERPRFPQTSEEQNSRKQAPK